MYMYVHTHIHTYIYTHIYIYITAYTHAHTIKVIHPHHTQPYLAQLEMITTIFKHPATLPQTMRIK